MLPMAFQRASMVLAPMRLRRRQEQEPSATLLENGFGFLAFVAAEVVEDDNVTWLKRGGELGLDVGVEDLAIHGLVDHPRGDQAVAA